MFFMSPLWSGSTSGFLDLCVSAISRIPLEMSGIPFVALSPKLCGYYRSWRARTGQLNLVKRNGKSWGRLLVSCYKCVSQYFQLVSVLCLTGALVCVKGDHSLVGVWCLRCCAHQESKIMAQGCTGRCHWPILHWQGCYSCGYVGGHNWRGSWG